MHRRGELRARLFPVRGDITLAAVTAGVLYGTTRIAGSILAAPGSPRELWIVRIYLQIGDPTAPGHKLLGAAVFAVAALEEIAWRNGWIDRSQLRSLAESLGKSPYAAYLRDLTSER